jgi:hypothetical protein
MNILRYVYGLGVLVLVAAVGELVSDEIRARLDRIPLALLAAAARRLPREQRAKMYGQVWFPELHYLLQGDEAMPITRLVHGMRYALRIWLSAPKISCELNGDAARQPISRLLSTIFRPSFRTALLLGYPPLGAIVISNTVTHGSWVNALMAASFVATSFAIHIFGRWLWAREQMAITWCQRRGAAPLLAAMVPTALVLTCAAAVVPFSQHGLMARLLSILIPSLLAIFLFSMVFGFRLHVEPRQGAVQGDVESTASTA